jgi:hypothetical protein
MPNSLLGVIMFRESSNLTLFLRLKLQLCIQECRALLSTNQSEFHLVNLHSSELQFLTRQLQKSDPFGLESFLRSIHDQGLDQDLGKFVESLFEKDFTSPLSVFINMDLEYEGLDELQAIYQKVNDSFSQVLASKESVSLDLQEVSFHRGLQTWLEVAKYRINLALAELISLEGYTILAVNAHHIEVKRRSRKRAEVTPGSLQLTDRQWTQPSRGMAVGVQFEAC